MIRAVTLKEIYWKGKNYRMGTEIKIKKEDARILRNAGVIGNLRAEEIETMTRKAPENTKRTYKKKRTSNENS